jgi:hypothetical protein
VKCEPGTAAPDWKQEAVDELAHVLAAVFAQDAQGALSAPFDTGKFLAGTQLTAYDAELAELAGEGDDGEA